MVCIYEDGIGNMIITHIQCIGLYILQHIKLHVS